MLSVKFEPMIPTIGLMKKCALEGKVIDIGKYKSCYVLMWTLNHEDLYGRRYTNIFKHPSTSFRWMISSRACFVTNFLMQSLKRNFYFLLSFMNLDGFLTCPHPLDPILNQWNPVSNSQSRPTGLRFVPSLDVFRPKICSNSSCSSVCISLHWNMLQHNRHKIKKR